MTTRRWQLTGMTISSLLLAATAVAQQEVEDRGVYYEDDAWYDVSEWLDGNDYNPTDEDFWEWDDAKYDFHEETGDDWDNDVYGYSNNEDWFYDYYDDDYVDINDYDANMSYDFVTHYIDVDNDGFVDAFYSFSDSDADGTFDRVSYTSLNRQGQAGQSRVRTGATTNEEWKRSTKPVSFTGEVMNMKTVTVRDQQHVVAELKTKEGKNVAIDLGKKDNLRQGRIDKGSQLTVHGFESKVGDKKVVFATSIESDGQKRQIQRGGKQFSGQITDTRQITIDGKQHTLAMIKTDQGKQLLVDVGPADQMRTKFDKGQKLTVSGVPAKVQDKVVVMATEMEMNGQMHDIRRNFDQRSGMNRGDRNQRPGTGDRPGTNRPGSEKPGSEKPGSGRDR